MASSSSWGLQAEVFSLGQVVSQEAVGIFVDAALPRAMRVGEVDLDAGLFG